MISMQYYAINITYANNTTRLEEARTVFSENIEKGPEIRNGMEYI